MSERGYENECKIGGREGEVKVSKKGVCEKE